MSPPLTHTDPRRWMAPAAKWQTILFVVSLAVCFSGAVVRPASFWPAGLVAIAFWTSISLGCLGIGLLHPLTGGLWGWGVSRELTAGLGTIPLTGLFLLPLFFAAHWVFPWARSPDELNAHQRIYLAPLFVLTRTLIEWGLWSGLALWLMQGYRRMAADPSYRPPAKIAAAGLIVFWFSVTSASIDGLMSLEPQNNSSMFGAIETIGCAVAGLAWILLMRCRQAADSADDKQISHDLGNLLFAFTLIWVYLAFSQYLIVWAADLPDEASWHAARQRGTAGIVGGLLLLIHFIVPFGLLLSADLKRQPRGLAIAAGILLAARVTDFVWTVFPACPGTEWHSAIWLVATFGLLGPIWVTTYRYVEARLPLIDSSRIAAIDKDTLGVTAEVTP